MLDDVGEFTFYEIEKHFLFRDRISHDNSLPFYIHCLNMTSYSTETRFSLIFYLGEFEKTNLCLVQLFIPLYQIEIFARINFLNLFSVILSKRDVQSNLTIEKA